MSDGINRWKYLGWATARVLKADSVCPICGNRKTRLVKRKYLVTALYLCPSCDSMFRVPKTDVAEAAEFYQTSYSQGFTTDCPSDAELAAMKKSRFAGTEKDYTKYIEVLRALGLADGSTIFDFGCSWGYGSWQMGQAGYRVYSTEISTPRARYAAEKLGCLVTDAGALPEKVDCFFSCHVIEHLPDPGILWEAARRSLKPGGRMVLFLPNGNPDRENIDPNYHQMWGEVHPLLLSPSAVTKMGERHGFRVECHSSPFDPEEIRSGAPGDLTGYELLVVASLA